jgi:hypothetical protein
MGMDESIALFLSLWSLGCLFKQPFARRKPTRTPNTRTRIKEIVMVTEIRIAVFDFLPAFRIPMD